MTMTSSRDERGIASDGDVAQILRHLGRWDPDRGRALPEERGVATRIAHLRQADAWDCGIACLQMVMQWGRREEEDGVDDGDEEDGASSGGAAAARRRRSEAAWLRRMVGTTSIWTIDLVFLVERLFADRSVSGNAAAPTPPLSYVFCSTKFGVDPDFIELDYYRDQFSADELRVQRLFDLARKGRPRVPLLRTPRLSLESLVDIVDRRGVVAIVLLDNKVLANARPMPSYSGHYVLLCGVSRDEDRVRDAHARLLEEGGRRGDGAAATVANFAMVVKNPAHGETVEFVAPSLFEFAWRARGTDEDVVFFSRRNPRLA